MTATNHDVCGRGPEAASDPNGTGKQTNKQINKEIQKI